VSILAEDVITAARDGHAAFSKARHPNAGLLRALAHYKKQLWGKIANVNSSVLAVEEVIDLTTFNFATGQAFPANIYVVPDGEVSHPNDVNQSDRGRFTLIDYTVRQFTRPQHCGWFIQNQLWLHGDEKDWVNTTNLYISYVAIPTGPAAMDDDFDPAPDTIEYVVETYLAKIMAGKGHADATLPPIDLRGFVTDWQEAENRFLAEQGEKRKHQRIKTLDVFPGGR